MSSKFNDLAQLSVGDHVLYARLNVHLPVPAWYLGIFIVFYSVDFQLENSIILDIHKMIDVSCSSSPRARPRQTVLAIIPLLLQLQLDILAGMKLSGKATGTVKLNGLPVKATTIRQLASYVMQKDVLVPSATVSMLCLFPRP